MMIFKSQGLQVQVLNFIKSKKSALLIRPRPSNALALGGHLDRKQSKMGGGIGGSMGMTRRIIRDPKTETKIAIFGEAKAPPGEDFQCRMTKLLLEATDKV